MRQKPAGRPSSSEQIVKDIRRNTRKQYGAEEKIRIVLDGLRGEDSIAELCRREGLAQSLYYKWSKDFMEAGKKRLAGDIVRQANTGDVTTLRREARELAMQASGCDQAAVVHKPRLLSDNGPSYISGELADWLEDNEMSHVRGAPYHPQTQGKIERWHQTLKNRILLENYFLPGDLEKQIETFVDHYNHQRYHESLKNLTPADVYFGRGQSILAKRERVK